MVKTPSTSIQEQRRRAVELRLAGVPLVEVRRQTGLSAPTIIEATRAFGEGGWEAVDRRRPGRPPGVRRRLAAADEAAVIARVCRQFPSTGSPLWTLDEVKDEVERSFGLTLEQRALSRMLARIGLGFATLAERADDEAELSAWRSASVQPLVRETRREPGEMLWCGECRLEPADEGATKEVPTTVSRVLVAQTLRGRLAWMPLAEPFRVAHWIDFLDRIVALWPATRAIFLHGVAISQSDVRAWAARHPTLRLLEAPQAPGPKRRLPKADITPVEVGHSSRAGEALSHLQRLESDAIHIIREVVAECERPVLLYTGGKDSATVLHLARKAFFPAPLPFPLLHIDSTWEFREMYAMRERVAREYGLRLIVHRNPEAERLGINPFTHGSQVHADQWNTEGLRQALDAQGFDAAFGGARRDEEKSRAKERVFSFRTAQHRWDPRNQRPELWNLYNARKARGESIRVFPLSNWTELDVWQYILSERIPIVPLYLAKPRPVVERNGTLLMVDDERLPLEPGEVPVMRKVRFRTLGCYPLSGAIESEAETLPQMIEEMRRSSFSERQGRLIDHDGPGSMERKKREGYF